MEPSSFQDSDDYSRKELALIFSGCAAAFAVAYVMSFWRLTPSPVGTLASLFLGDAQLFWTCGLAASIVVACVAASNWKETLALAATVCAIAVMAFWTRKNGQSAYLTASVIAKWSGVFGILVLGLQARRPGGLRRLLIVICFSMFVPISTAYLALTFFVRPDVLDFHAYAYDLSLGVPVAPYFYTLYHKSSSVAGFSTAAYVSLVASYEILLLVQTRFPDRSTVPSLRLFLLAAVGGFAAYFVFPVAGPIYFFHEDYPGHLPPFGNFDIEMFPTYLTARNGMPSLHFAWALLLAFNVPRDLRFVRAAFSMFCWLTGIAALGMGEHYLVDLIAALPFAGMIQGIGLALNESSARAYLISALRSALVFALFLLLVAGSPQWLHEPVAAWSVTLALVVHLVLEIRWQRKIAHDRNGTATIPQTVC